MICADYLEFGGRNLNDKIKCPECGKKDVLFIEKHDEYLCKECSTIFKPKKEFKPLRIFLSYGHDGYASIADKLKDDLVSKGHNVWFDSERLKSGFDWENYIEEGLEWVSEKPKFGRVILIMTPHSVRRPDGYCLNEITRALQRNLNIIPIMLVLCESPLSICRIQWLDMRDCIPLEKRLKNYETKYNRLIEALEEDKIDFEGFQSKLYDVLDPLPFEAEILQHLRHFTGRGWIIDSINKWLDNPVASRIFWITGPPGAGKTAIASWLCQNQREVVAFHLCQYGHALKSDPRRCVLSIAYQLSTQLPDYMERLKNVDLNNLKVEHTKIMDFQVNAKTIFDLLILQPLSRNFPNPDRNIVILIDALDEATIAGKNELASFIATEFQKTPDWLRLIITSRPDPEVNHPLQGLNPFTIDTESSENINDIKEFLSCQLSFLTGEVLPNDLIDRIVGKSEGNFLYAEWIIEEIKNLNLSINKIDTFPQGLGGVYAQFLERQFPDIVDYKKTMRPALELVSAAQENLDIKVITSILNWDEYNLNDFNYSLGSLFLIKENKIQPFHKSIMDWITNPDKAGYYYVNPEKGHENLSNIGWEEYSSGIGKMSEYMLNYLPVHLYRSGKLDEFQLITQDPDYMVELISKSFHEKYLEEMKNFKTLDNPAMQPWEKLSNSFKDNNRSQARDVPKKFYNLGYKIRYSSDKLIDRNPKKLLLTSDEIEIMAQMEHQRYIGEKLKSGWVFGPERDNELKESPYLVPWEELSETIKNVDREAVRKIPEIIEDIGFEIYFIK